MTTTDKIKKINLGLQGMSCASCGNRIEKVISNLPGVKSCNVNFAMEQAAIAYNPLQTSTEEIQKAVVEAGYSSYPVQKLESIRESNRDREVAQQAISRNFKLKIIVGSIVSLILIFGSLPMMTGLDLPLFLHGYIIPGYS